MPAAGPAQEAVIADTESSACGGQLADAVFAELVLLIPGQVGQVRRNDLAELTQRAGNERDAGTLRRVLGHRGASPDRLVVRVRVHEQQPPAIGPVHAVRITRLSCDRLHGRGLARSTGMTNSAMAETATTDTFPRQQARTRNFSLGAPRSF